MRRAVLAGLVTAALIAVALALLPADGDDNANGTSGKRGEATKPLVVMLVLDEFPIDDIVLPDGRIDSARFPNFAALAGTSTWFPNATSVYDSTFKAVPAILDARLPREGTAPDVRSHQPSIFHMMDRLGYDVIKVESGTALCPPRICEGARTRRPGVLKRLAGGGRPARLHRWIGAIRDRQRPTFYFQHALLPHEPWIYLPSGHQSRLSGNDPIEGINRPEGFHDPLLTDHNHLRHLLQVGYVDRQLGLIMRRMRRTGIFDRSLFILVADHGIAFEVGVKERRQVSETNFEQIAAVPFFVKRPHQTVGRIDDGLVRNIDVVPTVADVLGTKVWWQHDGRSVFSPAERGQQELVIPRRDFSRVLTMGRAEFERRRAALRLWRARKYGTGLQSQLLFGDPWASAYRIGTHPELIGRRVRPAAVAASTAVHGTIANARLLAAVERSKQI
ncbi:MAG: sulfatase-like hydrolase/transferase, partial [Actinomycetota bacterium]|nr:sulfatase-like hydrolase/transferase [Actinomycetota bacterium]